MALVAEIGAKLDTGALVSTLTGRLTAASDGLDDLEPPAADAELTGAGNASASIDFASILASAGPLTGQLEGLIAAIPGAGDALGPITERLALVENLLGADLESQISQLAGQLGGILEGEDESFVNVLTRFADALADAPQGAVLKGLFEQLLGAGGVSLPAGLLALPDIVPALTGAMRSFGALMSLETLLAEAERLTGIMARQLDTDWVSQLAAALEACLAGDGASLAQFVAGVDTNNPAEVAAAVAAIDQCAGRLRELATVVGDGMAFGEATLVYLDLARLQGEVARVAELVRAAELTPIERALRSVIDRIAGVLQLDLSGVPSFSLDNLLTQAEARAAALAAGIAAFDASALTGPLTTGITAVTDIPNALTQTINEVTVAIRGALETVRDAVAALPFGTIGDAIRQALQPVADALAFIGDLVDAIKDAIGDVVDAAVEILDAAEDAVDEFREDVEALFAAAADFVEGLHVDQVVGQIADNIQAFADLIAKAQMRPYFDTAVDVLDVTTGVVEKVPFSLLPDSMESEVVAAIRPIKSLDIGAVETEIETLLQIGPDGKFALRPDIEAALADIKAKHKALVDEIAKFDVEKLVEQLDAILDGLADKIKSISPQVELAPLQEAIDAMHAAVAGIDLDTVLQPLRDGFASILAAIDQYSPAQLITPIEQRVDQARDKLIELTRLEQWAESLDMIEARALELIDRFDPAQLEPTIRSALDEALAALDTLPELHPAGAFGGLITAMLAGAGLRINPLSFDSVLGWLSGQSGSAALHARTAAAAGDVGRTRVAVAGFDPAALAGRLGPNLAALQAAAAGLSAGAGKEAITAAVAAIDVAEQLGSLSANRNRYLAELVQAEAAAGLLARVGLSEVDVVVGGLRGSIAPLAPFTGLLAQVCERIGLGGLEQGVPEAARRLLTVLTPARLIGLVMPIFTAVRTRIAALISEVIAPLKAGIASLLALLNALDLTPLREAVDAIYQEVRGQILLLHPDTLLGEVITAFTAAQQQVATFNPLVDIQTALTALRDTAARVVGKLDAGAILARPIEVYRSLVDAFAQLDVEALAAPLLDQLDEIARQVDEGLDETVEAFKRLQDALPSRVGSTSISASASVG
jgi:hypothetical protein